MQQNLGVSCRAKLRAPGLEQSRDRADYDTHAYLATLERLLGDPPNVIYPGHGTFCLSKTEQWIGEEITKLLRARGQEATGPDDGAVEGN